MINLEMIRKQVKIPLADVAEHMNMSRQRYRRVEQGLSSITLKQLEDILSYLQHKAIILHKGELRITIEL
jgi:transcriptional regulator with XRE-family HTH domain